MKTKPLQIWITTDLHDKLDVLAKRDRRSKSMEATALIEREILRALSEMQDIDAGITQVDVEALR